MRAVVGDTADRISVHEHLVDDTKIAGTVILERVPQQSCASLLQEQFQGEIEGITADCSSPVGNAASEVWLIIHREC